jgi:hypothetical protein
MYVLVSERNHEEVSVPNVSPTDNELKSLGTANYINPRYRYVLTRLGGVQTARRTIARAGPLALEERVDPLDVTVASTTGIATPVLRLDRRGYPSIVGPLNLFVIGGGTAPAWVRLRFQTIAPARTPPQPGVRARSTAHTLTVCVRATGTAPVRSATLELAGTVFRSPEPNEPYAPPEPPRGVELVAMRAVTHCSLAGAA